MCNDFDIDLLYTLAGPGKPGLSEAELSALDPLPEDYFREDGQPPVSIADALLRFREDLSGLLRDGERLSRFSAEYIHTSRLIRHGITVLGQGLMTLRREGFDLSSYPLRIRELRCLASFHFKKIMNGARVAAVTNQTVYYRCMGEYPEWVKLLCRLEVSERRLSEPVKAVPAPRHTPEIVVEAAAAAEARPVAAEALPAVPALPALSESRRKELLSARENPEGRQTETVRTEAPSAPGRPYAFSAFTLPGHEAPRGKILPGCSPRCRNHPPREP